MQAMAQNFGTFVAARAMLGFSTSFISQPSPIIVAELAYPSQRGKVTALYNTFYYFGSIFAAWCTYGTFKIDSTWSWRIPSLLQGAIPALQLLGVLFVPESPRYLVSRGKLDEARRIFADHHADGVIHSPLVDFEMNEIQETLAMESRELSATSQWNGVGVVSYYLTLVLNTIGITEVKDQTLINGLLQIFNWLAATFLGALMVDRLGRRTLFLVSTAGMLASYIIWTALTANFVQSGSGAVGKAVVGFIFVYYFFYDIAWTPLLQAYPVEIFPYTLRSRGLTVTYISAFSGLIVGNQVNPIAMKNIQWKYYTVFCCLLALLLVLIWAFFPETKGHTLEEIAEVFEGKRVIGDENKLEIGQVDDGAVELDETGKKHDVTSAQIERAT
ncbi:hypothetical protein G7Z17_g909 [Cylindrodendrum hubeiense]|uniref:Major facilitator superfamily (MFS) profile domain-containing protein n=1 Tax=Cylindrodendrum hubeiense TaxID=595255 RepID=A0A9P5LKJ9_9HYPO|nr:hypothetical protein G7Z17_g909 [Cylindrodendrum hubeiense]